MKPVTVILLAALWAPAGCRTSEPVTAPRPELVHISSLPTLDPFVHPQQLTLNILFCILRDGTVGDLRMLGTSGDAKWDAAAIDSMRAWLFTGVPDATPPEGLWIRQVIIVKAEERLVMTLGELTVASEHEADSLYALLEKGVAFESLLGRDGAPPRASAAILGPVDISQYPGRVRDKLRDLDVYDVTRPIRVGVHYVIYQRLDHEAPPVKRR